MSELDLRRSPWNEGLGVPAERLRLELYSLCCIALASPHFETLGLHSGLGLREQFQEAEVGRILLSFAAAVRNAMDQNPSRADYWLEGVDAEVGQLEEEGKGSKPLQFREACNKIIHCLAINFDYSDAPMRRGSALNPVVYLYGTKGSVSWRATLQLMKFVDVGFQLT